MKKDWVLRMFFAGAQIFPAPSETYIAEFMARLRAGWPELDNESIEAASRHLNEGFSNQLRQQAQRKALHGPNHSQHGCCLSD